MGDGALQGVTAIPHITAPSQPCWPQPLFNPAVPVYSLLPYLTVPGHYMPFIYVTPPTYLLVTCAFPL